MQEPSDNHQRQNLYNSRGTNNDHDGNGNGDGHTLPHDNNRRLADFFNFLGYTDDYTAASFHGQYNNSRGPIPIGSDTWRHVHDGRPS